jgi:UDP-3-O-[3-hydroxymyristoyl] glucosamine N-acyltransferase
MKKILIFSAGSAGREVYQLIDEINKKKKTWNVIGYVDSNLSSKKKYLDKLKVFSLKNRPIGNDIYGITGVMSPKLREKIYINEIIKNKYKIPNLIHPNIYAPPCFVLGKGNIIFNNVHISFEVKLSNFSVISNFSDVGHNLNSKDYLTIMPSVTVGGNCKIGKNVLIGSGVNILQNLKIDDNCQIGIGSTLSYNLSKNSSLIEFQRKIIKKNVL